MTHHTENSPKLDADVIVVGGGHAGLSMTAILGAQGLKVICVDRETPSETLSETFDGRTTAISFGSQKVLAEAGIWDVMAESCCPIENIQILDGADSPVFLEFDSSEVGGRIFGWIAENRRIRHALYKRIDALPDAKIIAPAQVTDFKVTDDTASVILADDRVFTAKLIVGADGRGSFTRDWMGIDTRQWSYKQRAVVCIAQHENPHNNIAVEHFHAQGPFAALPMLDDENGNHRSSVVWTEHCDEKDSSRHYSEELFNMALTDHFPDFYGKVKVVGGRYAFPLGLVHAHNYIAPRMALVADAAHGIHPIAGQGLNLGFRDIAALCELIAQAADKGADIGSDELLQSYQRQRRFDNMAMAGATDVLNKLFSNDITPVRIARKAGMRAISKLPFAKQFFMKQAMGGAGILPAMIKDGQEAA
ncbi:MAG TPA: FAD-binding protein [Micavibrio sp.]|nr:FAD-binding protein [Micavibrio sp.]